MYFISANPQIDRAHETKNIFKYMSYISYGTIYSHSAEILFHQLINMKKSNCFKK